MFNIGRCARTAAAIMALGFLALPQAHAATVTSVNADNATLTAISSASLDLPNGGSWSTLPGSPEIESGSVAGQYRSPFEGLGVGSYEDIDFWNVVANNTAILSLGSLRSTFSVLWGSVDNYNALRLTNVGAGTSIVIGTAGAEAALLAAVGGSIDYVLGTPDAPVLSSGASLVTVSGFMFDQVEFITTTNSIEFSNVAAVPLPAAGLLLIGGLGALAAVRRRKKDQA